MNRGVRSAKRNPFYSNKWSDVAVTIGTESGNAIALACQFKLRTNECNERVRAKVYLSSDANGDVPVHGILAPTGGVAVGTDGTLVQGSPSQDALYDIATLTIGSTPERYTTTTTAMYTVGGGQRTKAAAANNVFSAAHTVTASLFGVILVQVNAAGTLSTKVPSATQAYASAALAFAALPAPDAGNVALGHIAIANNAGDWVANTDDLTNGSDLTTATFVDAPANGTHPATLEVISEADGDLDLTITETRVRTFYANFLHPDGSVYSVGPIAFA